MFAGEKAEEESVIAEAERVVAGGVGFSRCTYPSVVPSSPGARHDTRHVTRFSLALPPQQRPVSRHSIPPYTGNRLDRYSAVYVSIRVEVHKFFKVM